MYQCTHPSSVRFKESDTDDIASPNSHPIHHPHAARFCVQSIHTVLAASPLPSGLPDTDWPFPLRNRISSSASQIKLKLSTSLRCSQSRTTSDYFPATNEVVVPSLRQTVFCTDQKWTIRHIYQQLLGMKNLQANRCCNLC